MAPAATTGSIPDGPMLDRIIGDAMGTPDLDFTLRTRFGFRGIYAFSAVLGLAATFVLIRRNR